MHIENMRAAELGGYRAVCLAAGTDLKGADRVLRPYYHISHIPREGGHCYFRFPEDEVVRLNPHQAQDMFKRDIVHYGLSYRGTAGIAVYFKNPDKYRSLIAKLNQLPPVSRNEYGKHSVVHTTKEAIDILSQPLEQEVKTLDLIVIGSGKDKNVD